MTDISSNVERIIEKLDGMTTEVVPKSYGTDIASKVDHIAKQLDYVQAGSGSGLSKFPIIDCYTEGTLISGVCDTDYADIVNEIENGRAVYSIVNIRIDNNVYTTVGISIAVVNDEITVSCLPDFNDSSVNNYVTFIRPSLSISSDNSCFGVMARFELLKSGVSI